MNQIPLDFFYDPLSQGNFIHQSLCNLYDSCYTAYTTIKKVDNNDIIQILNSFKDKIYTKFAIDISIEYIDKNNDDDPIIIEL